MEVIYDAGALIAAGNGSRPFSLIAQAAARAGTLPRVPTTVLAQVWRGTGPKQALLSLALRTCQVVPFDEEAARLAGTLCGRAGTSDVVDASVVILAVRYRAGIVTSDRGDIAKLIDSLDADLRHRPPVIDI